MHRDDYFFVFIFDNAFPLRTRFLVFDPAAAAPPFLSFGLFRTRSLSDAFAFTPFSANAFACFFARRRATRSASVDLTCLRSSFERPSSFAPRFGSPLGTCTGVGRARGRGWLAVAGADFVGTLFCTLGAPGRVLQRWTRSLRFANLRRSISRARTSSTHSRS